MWTSKAEERVALAAVATAMAMGYAEAAEEDASGRVEGEVEVRGAVAKARQAEAKVVARRRRRTTGIRNGCSAFQPARCNLPRVKRKSIIALTNQGSVRRMWGSSADC